MKIAIVIPVYNHGKTLREVITRCIDVCHSFPVTTIQENTNITLSTQDILVIDDGSSDKGLESIQDLPIQTIQHPINKGKGAALLTAAHALKEQGYSHMIALDADAQHYPEDIPSFIQAILKTPHAFIVGARDFSVPNIPTSSRFGRKFSQFWMFVQTGYNISDMQSGYRAYNLDALLCLNLSETRYSFEVEALVKAAWAGFAIEEIPIKVYYQKGADRISHFDKIQDNVRISILNTRLTIRALIPIPFRHHVLDVEGSNISLLSPLKSLHILLQHASPIHLALSSAIAFFICSLPLLGLQSILLLLCINTWHLNRLCALVVIPLSWPPVLPALCILVGYRVWNGVWLTHFSMETLYHQMGYRFIDWIVGSLILAPFLGLLMGLMVYIMSWILNKYYLRVSNEIDKVKWTSKSLGSRFQHNFFYLLIHLRLVWLARALIYFIVFYYTLVPAVRKRSSYYLRRRFPHSTAFGMWVHCYKLYANFANLLLARIVCGVQKSYKLGTIGDAREKFQNTLQEDTGCIIQSGHIGAWQMGILEIENIQRPINIVQFIDPDDNDKHYFEHDAQKRQHPIKIISSLGIQASIEITTALQNKELVCMTGDRVAHESEKSMQMPFLNGKIALPLAPFVIASIIQSPLLITFSILEKGTIKGVWAERIAIPKGNHRQAEFLRPYVQRFVAGLESMVEHYPYQFFNFYDIWLENNDT